MIKLVDIHDARTHLKVDSYADDAWIELMIAAVSAAVSDWLKDAWRLYVPLVDSAGNEVLDSNGDPVPSVDANGNPVVKYQVKAAVLVELAQQYRFRDGNGVTLTPSSWGYGYTLGVGATSLLAALRKSSIA